MNARVTSRTVAAKHASAKSAAAVGTTRPKTKPAAAQAARQQRGGHSGADAIDATRRQTAAKAQPVSLAVMFAIAPERLMATWLAASGAKVEPGAILDSALCDANSALHRTLSGNPTYDGFMKALWEPELLHGYTPPPAVVTAEAVQYARISAARSFLSLWVESEQFRNFTYGKGRAALKDLDAAVAAGHQSAAQRDLVLLHQEKAAELGDAFRAYLGLGNDEPIRELTELELYRVVTIQHSPTSRDGRMMTALQSFANFHRENPHPLGLSGNLSDPGWSLRSVMCVKHQLDFVQRLESLLFKR